MKNLSALAIPATIALVIVSAASLAQDKPNTAATKKSSAPVSAPATAAKATAQARAPLNSTGTKALGERNGVKQSAPSANQIAPAADRAHESCHDKGSDA